MGINIFIIIQQNLVVSANYTLICISIEGSKRIDLPYLCFCNNNFLFRLSA